MASITNKRSGTLRLAFGVVAAPGAFVVEDGLWEKCRVHPVTRHYLSRGDLVEAPEPDCSSQTPSPVPVHERVLLSDSGAIDQEPQREPDPPPADELPQWRPAEVQRDETVPDLADMRAKDAVLAAVGISDTETLRQLLQTERRATVARALKRRLSELAERE